jgi:hypothetical protein
MPKKNLTIEGITFPKFSKGSSKRNFRLIFFIAYKDSKGKNLTTIVTKPAGGEWQWKNDDDEFFLAEANDLGDSVELDVSAMHFDNNGFSADDYKITEISGKLLSVAVQFIDVFDASLLDFLEQKVLPKVIEELKKTGFDPIKLLPVPGVVTGVVKENVKLDDLVKKFEDFLTKEKKDKLLHKISAAYDGKKPFVLSGRKEWEKGKTGTYGVTIGFE